MAKAIVVDFDIFSTQGCPYFESDTSVNGGYGCRNPDCGDIEEDDDGQKMGCCRTSTCPLSCSFDEEAFLDPEVDKDGYTAESFLNANGSITGGGDYAVVSYSEDKSLPEMKALQEYQRYLHRYDSEWLSQHGF